MTDLDRLPQHLRADIDRLLSMDRAIDGAVVEMCALVDRIGNEYMVERHPTLGDPHEPDILDVELQDASSLEEAMVTMSAASGRIHHALHGDPRPDSFARFGLSGPGVDDSKGEVDVLTDTLAKLERGGYFVWTAACTPWWREDDQSD